MRWQWLSRVDDSRAWNGLDLQFAPEERALFLASTTMTIGNGQRALFWEDRWINGRALRVIALLLFAHIPKRRRKSRTVADGLHANQWATDIHGAIGVPEIGEYLRLWHMLTETALTDAPDCIRWKWTANGEYSAKSAYLATFHGSTRCQAWKLTWKCWAPPRVRFFHWLANLDRCWTADRLARRNLPHPQRCPLCDQASETIHHLLLECPFSREVWHEILSWLRLSCPLPNNDATLHDWWCSARQDTPKPMHKGLTSAALLVPWMIWKHRNGCVFEGATPSVTSLTARIKDEAALWARAGALGLRAILPQTWDVH